MGLRRDPLADPKAPSLTLASQHACWRTGRKTQTAAAAAAARVLNDEEAASRAALELEALDDVLNQLAETSKSDDLDPTESHDSGSKRDPVAARETTVSTGR